ncbi:hypothetical protein HC776_01460 [bacterium]|nr:hypothetical protein [bacterium]
MVRVASYIQKVQLGLTSTRPDGYTPSALLRRIREEVAELMQAQRQTKQDVVTELAKQDIHLISPADLSSEERAAVRDYFHEAVFPVLTPLAVDHARPFPFISNLSINLAIYLEREDADKTLEFARIKIPPHDILPRLLRVEKIVSRYSDTVRQSSDVYRFLWIEDIIQDNLAVLFPGMKVLEAAPFRVLRDADIDYEHEQEQEQDSADFDVMEMIENSVRERRFGPVVRVAVPQGITERMLKRILDGLEVTSPDVIYSIEGTLGMSDMFELAGIDRSDLKYPVFAPRLPEPPGSENIFSAIRRGDILLHHPYDSFLPVEDFFRQAAQDPDVLAIKATLYRVGKNSPVVQALMEARDNDKQVTVLVELKARFDEENNLVWATGVWKIRAFTSSTAWKNCP